MKLLLLCGILLLSTLHGYAQTWGASTFSQTINEANDIETNNLGEHYVAGHYSGQTSFGTTNSISNSQGNTDAYVAKYSSTGTVLWVKNFGGLLADRAVDLVIGNDQNIIVTGHYFGTVTFGSTTLTSVGNSKDIFLLKLDPAGNVIWAKSEGGALADNSNKVTVDSQNNILLTGEFQGTATIAGTSLTSSMNSTDFFVAKYTSAGTPVWVQTGQAPNDDKGMAIATDNANNVFVTGQFSSDMTFGGTTHVNVSLNIGFVTKLDANGNMLYFNMLRAGLVLPYDIKVNSNNEPIITGDFQGNLTYINGATNTSITNPYSKKIFTLKTANSGQYIWNNTLGSNNEISARALAIDPSNQIYVTGFFRCDLSQMQDTTKNLFSSVGFRDPYLLKLSNAGSRINIKHFGGKQDDEGKGVSSRTANNPVVCGSFTSDLNFQQGASVNLGFDNYTFSQFFGPTDPSFVFLTGDLSRNSFITTHINNNYGNYDFFKIPTTDSLEGYIRNAPNPTAIYSNDTIHFCTDTELYYETQTWPYYGPDYTYSWNAGSTLQTQPISTQGNYWVTVTRLDGCAVEIDSIFAKKHPIPNLPLMTDNHGFNTNQVGSVYNTIELCHPDVPIVNYTNLDPGSTMILQGPGVQFNGPGPHQLTNDSTYYVIVSNQYCSAIGTFDYFQYLNVIPDVIDLSIVPDKPVLAGDTIKICLYDYVEFHGVDLITNPSGNFNPQLPQPYDTLIWHIDGGFTLNYDTATSYISPTTSGWHTVKLSVSIGYDNFCGTDTTTYTVTKNYYIQILPVPGSGITISGGSSLCPNSSELLVASLVHPNLHWTGANIVWNNGSDSIEVNAPGWYNYNGQLVDPVSGCSNYVAVNHYVTVKVAPNVNLLPADGVICPNDSLQMTVPNSFVSYLWINQNGDTISNNYTCFTDNPGYYMCQVTDADGCSMWTAPVDVFEYATPSFSVSPNAALCSGESVEVELNFSGNASFQWQNLPSNSNPVTITTPGTYYVQITQCGTSAFDSIVIIDASISPTITVSDSVLCFGETAHFVGSVQNATYDWTNGANTNHQYSTTTAGSYSATVTNSYGCSAQTNTINITTVPVSVLPNVPSQTICSGDDVVLTEDNVTVLNWYSLDSILLYTGTTVSLTNIIQDTSFLVAYTTGNPICGVSYQQVDVTFIATLESFQVHGDSVLCQGENGLFTATTTDPVEWFINGNSLGTSNPIAIPFATLNNQHVFSVSTSNVCFTVTIQDSVQIITPTMIQLSQNPVSICFKETEQVSVTNTNLTSITWTGNFGTYSGNPLTLHGDQNYTPITVSAIDQYGCPATNALLNVNTSTYTLSSTSQFPNYCIGTIGQLHATTTSDSVRWISPAGTISHSNPLSVLISNQSVGNYILQSWDDMGCMYQDTVFVPISASPDMDFLHDTLICANQNFVVSFPTDGNTYYWNTYGNQTTFFVTGDMQLILNSQNSDGCLSQDTLFIQTVNCDDALPNIITANGDGINDYFIIDESVIQPNNRLIIFNRWGNPIYEAAPYKNNFSGIDVVDGVYFYLYYPNGDDKQPRQGFVHIVR